MRRNIALLILFALLAMTWMRSDHPKFDRKLWMRVVPLNLPPAAELAKHLGPFRLEGAWDLQSRTMAFGSYSALVPTENGQLHAISDLGYRFAFSPPGAPPAFLEREPILEGKTIKSSRDFEAATMDPATGRFWLAAENTNRIYRFRPDWTADGTVAPPGMADWPVNTGPESIVRLADGRFVVLCECYTDWLRRNSHAGLLFSGDPVAPSTSVARFTVKGPAEFRPVDMAQMPDGRVLVLMRALVWPMPQRFAGRIAIGDPAGIRSGGTWKLTPVASLSSNLPVDNFEGMMIAPRLDGRLTVWIISDDNLSNFQRTLLWKLVVDPADLPRP